MNIIPVEFTVGFGGVEYGKTGLGGGDGDGDTDLYSECSHRIFLMETVAWKYDCATRVGLEVK